MIDIERVRNDTPGCENVVHFNNAGSSLSPAAVVDAQVAYLRIEANVGGYEAQGMEQDHLKDLYSSTALYLGCDPSDIAFTSSGSDGWWRAFSAIPLQAGDRMLVGRSEFQTGAYGFLQARERGIQVDVVPNDGDGLIDLDILESLLDDDVKLVALTHVSMSNGAIQPAEAVGRLAKSAGAMYLLDACQSAGQLPLNVNELECDFLVYTGRKFMRGPRGTGILYARPSVLEQLGPLGFVDGKSASWTSPDSYEYQDGAARFEFGEQNYAGKVGLAVATRYMLDLGITEITSRTQGLAAEFRDALGSLPGVTVLDEGVERSGIVTFNVEGVPAQVVQSGLRDQAINVSAPAARNAQLDMGLRGIPALVRTGIHYYNTEQEIGVFADALRTIS